LGFQIPPIFCISQLASSGASLKKNLKKIFGFSDPANFLHASSRASLKKNLKKKFGFSDPANFLHQPACSLKKNPADYYGVPAHQIYYLVLWVKK
jgi:hypothetical protein